MDKILICLRVPGVEQEYEVFVPDFLPVHEIVKLIVENLENATQNVYATSGQEVLCRKRPEMMLAYDLTFRDYGIRHGEILYLL